MAFHSRKFPFSSVWRNLLLLSRLFVVLVSLLMRVNIHICSSCGHGTCVNNKLEANNQLRMGDKVGSRAMMLVLCPRGEDVRSIFMGVTLSGPVQVALVSWMFYLDITGWNSIILRGLCRLNHPTWIHHINQLMACPTSSISPLNHCHHRPQNLPSSSINLSKKQNFVWLRQKYTIDEWLSATYFIAHALIIF